MNDLNDLFFFASVVEHKGFSAAARATGIDKTRMSRRVAALEEDLGVRLLQRTTRSIGLTEAGRRFYERCQAVVDGARSAYEEVGELTKEPSGNVRVSCPHAMAQNYLAPMLPGFMAAHPKVSVYIESTDRVVDPIDERFDLVFRASSAVEDAAGLVAREFGQVRLILVANPAYLTRIGGIAAPDDLQRSDIICSSSDLHDQQVRWGLLHADEPRQWVSTTPRLVSNDLRVQLEASIHGIGVALVPEPIVATAIETAQLVHVLPEWSALGHIIHFVYPRPRGMLPSVRSLIDYLCAHIPTIIAQNGVAPL
ncbi:MAG: LysR family transcriptional regulator [Burkholderiales bacterium]|nr:LysR family transcriptional regulator [Burkholderiales bacterium]